LDAERPWHVMTFYEVGIVARARGKALGEALFNLQRFGGGIPPGRFRYRTEPFRR
jgi:hypothetical protein